MITDSTNTHHDPDSEHPVPLRIWQPDAFTAAVDIPKRSATGEAEVGGSGAAPAGTVTHPLAGPGLRLAAEALDLLLLASLALMASAVITLPWVAPAAEPSAVAALSDTVSKALTGDMGSGPVATAAAADFAARTAQAWIVLTFGVHLVLPVLLALGGQGRTPGLILLGLRPIGIWSGDTPGIPALLLRSLGRIADSLPLFFLGGLWASSRDPLGARRFFGEQISQTALLRSTPLSEELTALGVPVTAYGTQEVGYLVEALLVRVPNLHPDRAHFLAHRLASLIARSHPEEITPDLQRLLDRNEPLQFLRALARNIQTP